MPEEGTTSLLVQAYAQAPAHIQRFLASGKFDAFLTTIQANLNLHADVMGKVSNEILMMLLGMSQPNELVDNLIQEAGLTQEQIAVVISEANEEIFLPLQREVLEEDQAPAVSPTPATPIYTPPTPSVPAYVPPAPVVVPPTPTVPSMPIPPAPAAPDHLTMRTMAHDIEVMKEGGVPAPTSYTPPTPVQPVIPAPPVQPTPPPVAPQPVRPTPPTSATPNAEALANTLQKYGIDPYREKPE